MRNGLILLICSVLFSCATTNDSTDYRHYYDLAAGSQNRADYAEAEHYHRLALAALRADSEYGPDWEAIQLSNLASAINQQQRPDEAKVLLDEALELLKGMDDPLEDDLTTVYANLAETEEMLGNYELAHAYYRQVHAVYVKQVDIMPAFLGFSAAGMARASAREGDLQQAEKYHALARRKYAESFGPDSKQWRRRETSYTEAVVYGEENANL